MFCLAGVAVAVGVVGVAARAGAAEGAGVVVVEPAMARD